jgi:serine protease Do
MRFLAMQMIRLCLLNSLVILASAISGAFTTIPARAQECPLELLQEQIYEVVDRSSPAIVEIRRRGTIFSGVIVSPEGHVLTAGHTIVPGRSYTVQLPDGRRLIGQALGASEQMRGERLDCGLIKVEPTEALPFVPLGSSEDLDPMQPCLSISYPGGQRPDSQPIVRFGSVRRPSRSGRMIQSSALMEPGDSGGPLLDLEGRLIGIHSRIGARMDQNYDVPIDVFKKHWDALNVAQIFASLDGRVLPRLGFIGRDTPEGEGITVLRIMEGSIAEQLGLQPNDILTKVQDQSLSSIVDLHQNLWEAMQSEPQQLSLAVKRGENQLEYQLSTERLILPKADRIPGLDGQDSASTFQNEASRFQSEEQFGSEPDFSMVDLESRWALIGQSFNEKSATISSRVGNRQTTIVATPLKDSFLLVSKNSMIGASPKLVVGDQRLDLTVIARSPEDDLVLLRSPVKNASGVSLDGLPSGSSLPGPVASNEDGRWLRKGQFVWSPQPGQETAVSVVGSAPFFSPRSDSRGYLGVVLSDYESGGVVLLEVDEGPAQRAGMKVGDILIGIGDSPILSRSDILKYLRSSDPLTSISIKGLRQSTEMDFSVTLGEPPSVSNHAADMMEKSTRRDGFTSIFCHDADLSPSGCGGPVFDSQGNWVALNIARYSRVRTFAIPAAEVIRFVKSHRKDLVPIRNPQSEP